MMAGGYLHANGSSIMAETKPSPHTVTLRGVPRVIDLGSVRDTPGHAERLLDFWVLGILLGAGSASRLAPNS